MHGPDRFPGPHNSEPGAGPPTGNARPTGLLGAITRSPMFAVLGFREFRLLWMGQFGSAMGMWMDQVTRGWLMYDLTGSALDLGLVNAVEIMGIALVSSAVAAFVGIPTIRAIR
jgi:hypothetical protein